MDSQRVIARIVACCCFRINSLKLVSRYRIWEGCDCRGVLNVSSGRFQLEGVDVGFGSRISNM